MTRHPIIFADMVHSVATAERQGQKATDRLNMQRLQDMEARLRMIDRNIERKVSMGDGILLIGTGDPAILLTLFREVVLAQGDFMTWPIGNAMRISMGYGEFEAAADGDIRGREINMAHRLNDKKICPEGSVVVTEAVAAEVIKDGHGDKLIRKEADLEGFGMTTYREVDGRYTRTPGSKQPSDPNEQRASAPQNEQRAWASERQSGRRAGDVFWKVLAAVALAGVFIVAAFVLWGHKG